mmetsp:Transcript_29608/g.71077  ORF Transcript_29608/g.71077 Transcript_29608/m.71077 type:complete len:215 (+) Transcript_29608:694-1338(+)
MYLIASFLSQNNSFLGLCCAGNKRQILRHGCSLVVGQLPSLFVANPAVDPSSSREDKQNVLEAEVFTKCSIKTPNGGSHEAPALPAHICTSATRPDVVIFIHVDVENKLTLNRPKALFFVDSVVIFGRNCKNCSDIDLFRLLGHHFLLQLLWTFEAKIPDVNIARKSKRQLAAKKKGFMLAVFRKHIVWLGTISKPLTEFRIREQPVVVHPQKI